MVALHVRGRGLPDGEVVEWWIVDGILRAEPVAEAETVFDGGWILPGLVDAHTAMWGSETTARSRWTRRSPRPSAS